MKYVIVFLLAVLLCTSVYARTVYKVVAADGTVTYTDQPVPGSTPVHLNKVNTSQPLARVNSATSPGTAVKTEKPIDYTLTITSPQDEATIRDNNGKFNINAQLTPAATGGRYQLIFDGQNVGESDTGNFELSNVVRGQHRFKVEYTDNKGKVLASSPSQTLFMHQASALINPTQ